MKKWFSCDTTFWLMILSMVSAAVTASNIDDGRYGSAFYTGFVTISTMILYLMEYLYHLKRQNVYMITDAYLKFLHSIISEDDQKVVAKSELCDLIHSLINNTGANIMNIQYFSGIVALSYLVSLVVGIAYFTHKDKSLASGFVRGFALVSLIYLFTGFIGMIGWFGLTSVFG